jgi:hypothetical protein
MGGFLKMPEAYYTEVRAGREKHALLSRYMLAL